MEGGVGPRRPSSRLHDPEMLLSTMPVCAAAARRAAEKAVPDHNYMRGKPAKKKTITRTRADHGVTTGAGSLTGLTKRHRYFDLPRA